MKLPAIGSRGLAPRFNALIVASILVTILSAGTLAVREQMTASHRQLMSDGAAVAAVVAASSAYAISTADRQAMQSIVEGLGNHPSVAYVRLADRQDRSLVERAFHSGGLPPLVHHGRAVEGTQAAVADRLAGRDDIDLVLPVLGAVGQGESAMLAERASASSGRGVIGYVQIGLSREGERQRLRASLLSVSASAALCVLLLGATLYLTRKVLSPIRSLSEPARTAALGRIDPIRGKSQLLASVNGGIRTPMNGVIGTTDLLMKTELSPHQRKLAENVRASAEALLEVIIDILDFSRIEAGSLELETVDFDLRQVIEDICNILAPRAQRKGLELDCIIHDGVATHVSGDPGRLRQILINLVGNAIKFTGQGKVVVRVTSEELSRESALLRFEVADTGTGLNRETSGRIFGAATQADGSSERRHGGTGHGLAIARHFAEMMGGSIGVESEPGKGSTFWFTARLGRQTQRARRRPSPRKNLQGLTVLIVDDNATNRDLLHHQVSSWGMRNASAECGSQALEMLREGTAGGRPYDIAILDMLMPDMDGLELARRIKSEESIAAVRLVLLTTVGLRGDGAEARRANVGAYLGKPVRQSDLYNCLATLMGRGADLGGLVTRHSLSESRPALQGHVLLAEDNPVNQEVILAMLESLGLSVDVAEDGDAALRLLDAGAYDLVLMDCEMPEKDGLEATTELRRREAAMNRGRMPVVALTANAMEGDRERCLAAGVDDCLSKPLRREHLAATVGRWLSADRGNQAGPATVPAGGDGGGAAAGIAAVGDPIDMKTLESMRVVQREGRPDILVRAVSLYLMTSTDLMRDLRQAADRGEAETMRRAAHNLKSSSAMVGALRLSALFSRLESQVREAPEAFTAQGLEEIDAEFARVFRALETISGRTQS